MTRQAPADLLPRLVTEPEAAAILKLHPRTLRKARQNGGLTYVRIGRSVRYTIPDLHAFLAASTIANDITRPPAARSRPSSRSATPVRTFTEREA